MEDCLEKLQSKLKNNSQIKRLLVIMSIVTKEKRYLRELHLNQIAS